MPVIHPRPVTSGTTGRSPAGAEGSDAYGSAVATMKPARVAACGPAMEVSSHGGNVGDANSLTASPTRPPRAWLA